MIKLMNILFYIFLWNAQISEYFDSIGAKNFRNCLPTVRVKKSNLFIYSEFVCQDVGIPCPPGVDKDLWQRFEAFEKWNAAQ